MGCMSPGIHALQSKSFALGWVGDVVGEGTHSSGCCWYVAAVEGCQGQGCGCRYCGCATMQLPAARRAGMHAVCMYVGAVTCMWVLSHLHVSGCYYMDVDAIVVLHRSISIEPAELSY
jgi:hypothetical protein